MNKNRKLMYALDLQRFGDVMNATTSATTGNDLRPEMKTFYDKNLIRLAEPLLVHDRFGQEKPIPRGNGKVIEFRKFSKLPKALTPLTEGVAPDGQALNVTAITATVQQYGGYVKVTDLLQLTSIDPIITEATELIGQQAGRTLDTITREVLVGGTNVAYANGKTARNALAATDTLKVIDVQKAVAALKAQDAPMLDGGYYAAIIHPNVAYDLMRDPEWIDWQKHTSPEHMYNGEIGRISNVVFFESTEAKIFEAGGASSANVYATLIIGKNAYGKTSIQGGGLETIIKSKEQAGGPLNQYSTIGWKATKTAERLVEEYMIRIESGCSLG